MNKTMSFSGIEVPSGTKFQGYLPVPGADVKIPVTIINGTDDGKSIVITSGVHSGEYPGIECAIEMAQEIDPKDVKGCIVFIHPCNPTGFEAQISYFVPEDGKNLGHCFPGDPNGTFSDKIGAAIMAAFFSEPVDMHLDLHGGDLHERLSTFVFAPKGGTEKAHNVSLEVSKIMNCKYIVMSGSGLGGYISEHDVPSITLERGDRGLCPQVDVEYYKRDVYNALRYFEVIPGEVNYAGSAPYIFKNCTMEYSPVSGCWYRNIELEEHFDKGQKLGEVRDFHGNVLHTVYAQYAGVCHSYWAALSIRKGQLMVGYGS